MTVSSGAVAGRYNFAKGHPCLLRLTSTSLDNPPVELRQYCAFSQSINQYGPQKTGTHSKRQTPPTVARDATTTPVLTGPNNFDESRTDQNTPSSCLQMSNSVDDDTSTEGAADQKEDKCEPLEMR